MRRDGRSGSGSGRWGRGVRTCPSERRDRFDAWNRLWPSAEHAHVNSTRAKRSQAGGSLCEPSGASDHAGDQEEYLAVKALGEISWLTFVRIQGDRSADNAFSRHVLCDEGGMLTTGGIYGRRGGDREFVAMKKTVP